MLLAYALPRTGHPNCRRPDKVIDAGHRPAFCFRCHRYHLLTVAGCLPLLHSVVDQHVRADSQETKTVDATSFTILYANAT